MDLDTISEDLTAEDYGPIKLFGFREYYNHYFTDLLDKVKHIIK